MTEYSFLLYLDGRSIETTLSTSQDESEAFQEFWEAIRPLLKLYWTAPCLPSINSILEPWNKCLLRQTVWWISRILWDIITIYFGQWARALVGDTFDKSNASETISKDMIVDCNLIIISYVKPMMAIEK